jgi:hypothetical protein
MHGIENFFLNLPLLKFVLFCLINWSLEREREYHQTRVVLIRLSGGLYIRSFRGRYVLHARGEKKIEKHYNEV